MSSIRIVDTTGNSTLIDTGKLIKIYELIDLLSVKTNTPDYLICLYYNGQLLNKMNTISSLNLQPNDFLYYVKICVTNDSPLTLPSSLIDIIELKNFMNNLFSEKDTYILSRTIYSDEHLHPESMRQNDPPYFPNYLSKLMSLGFDKIQSASTLRHNNYDPNLSAALLFENPRQYNGIEDIIELLPKYQNLEPFARFEAFPYFSIPYSPRAPNNGQKSSSPPRYAKISNQGKNNQMISPKKNKIIQSPHRMVPIRKKVLTKLPPLK